MHEPRTNWQEGLTMARRGDGIYQSVSGQIGALPL